MNERKIAQEGYVINGFKPFSQLAMEYFLGNPGIDLSRKRMRERIDEDLALAAKLSALGYTSHTTYLSPKMQEIIVLYLGPPYIVVPHIYLTLFDEKKL